MIGSRAIAFPAAASTVADCDWLIARGRQEARAVLGSGSKSFALAGALLGREARDDAAVLYAWCRQADDLVDDVDPEEQAGALERLGRELDDIYAGRVRRPMDVALHELISRRRIHREYFHALLDGFAMDAQGRGYTTLKDLDLYAYRVAGVVGLMMCHVLGVRDERCLRAAAHLGMGMQLTNIARDVVEDLHRGRQYLPTELLAPETLSAAIAGGASHPSRRRVANAVQAVLARADIYYESGLHGLRDLGWRSAIAIGAAARIYRAIGRILRRRRFDSLRGRAVVSLPIKLFLALCALGATAVRALPWRSARSSKAQIPKLLVRFDDVET